MTKREIKFRVWTGLKMEYDIVVGKLGAFYVSTLDPNDSASLSPLNTIYSKETPVMQYTGLLDRLGKEIYESDILKTQKGNKVVEYECATGFFGNLLDGENPSYLEIIGNIYENPELLNINKVKETE